MDEKRKRAERGEGGYGEGGGKRDLAEGDFGKAKLALRSGGGKYRHQLLGMEGEFSRQLKREDKKRPLLKSLA